MDDLISRQAALDALKAAYWDNDIQSAKDDPCIVDAMTDWAIRQVKALPTIDPVKHGEWIDHTKDYWCSECGGRIQKEQAKMFSTCPYCGARMDLGEDSSHPFADSVMMGDGE